MGHARSWKNPSTHITYNRGDPITITGTVYHSADGTSGTHGYYSNYQCYFYSYYTANWDVRVPVCIGNSSGSAWAFVYPDAIVSGGTYETYTIYYDSRGGSVTPAAQTKYWGYNLKLSSQVPAKTGYRFGGWSNTPNGSALWSAGGTYTANGGATLYAVWIPNKVYVYQHPNGGEVTAASFKVGNGGYAVPVNGPSNWYAIVYEHGSRPDNLWNGSSIGLRRTGYTYTGQWKERYSNRIVGEDENIFPNGARDYKTGETTADRDGIEAVYDAIWKANTYTVTYNPNGGTGAVSNTYATYDKDYTVMPALFTRAGYEFTGWDESPNGNGNTSWSKNINKPVPWTITRNVTLYAVWSLKAYKVKYNLNGGYGNFPEQSKTHGSSITLHTGKPVKSGYTFTGWYTIVNGEKIRYTAPTYAEDENITFFAEWELNKYNIVFNANGIIAANMPDNLQKVHGQAATIPAKVPTCYGYKFKEWNTSKYGTGSRYLPNSSYTANNGGVLYAIWDLEEYEVYFDAATNGGHPGSIQRLVKYNKAVGTLPVVEKKYYKFTGWFEDPVLETKPVTPETKITKDTRIYAHFVADASVHIGQQDGSWKAGFPFAGSKGKPKKGHAFVWHGGKWGKGIGGE